MNDFSSIEKLLNSGRYFEARSACEEAQKQLQDIRLDQLYALSLSKSGMPEAARDFLEPKYKSQPDEPETAGILGSIYKELFKKNQQTSFAALSRDTYLRNFQTTKNYYTGINAATVSAILIQASRSKEIAREVVTLINPDTIDFWELATLGEAYLHLKDREKALAFYQKARLQAGKDWGKVTSVYQQLWLLNHYVPVSGEILKIFNPPNVLAFVGHMVDHPTRPIKRFPPSIEPDVKQAISGAIKTLNVQIGFCSLACGSDILFAEALEEAGGEVIAFLPYRSIDFIETSLRFGGEHWVQRFQRLSDKFHPTLITDEPYGESKDLFSHLSTILFGTAILKSAQQHSDLHLLTVLSQSDIKRSEGGSRDALMKWPLPNKHININPDIFLNGDTTDPTPSPFVEPKFNRITNRPVLFLLYTEFLPDDPRAEKQWEGIKKSVAELMIAPSLMERTASSILIGFNSEDLALECLQNMKQILSGSLSTTTVKISLHSGPVYLDSDHQAHGQTVEVTQAIYRITGKGIYASDHFAAMLSVKSKKYRIDYSGVIHVRPEKSVSIYQVS